MYHKIENFALNPFKLMMPKKWTEQFVEVLHERKVSPPLSPKRKLYGPAAYVVDLDNHTNIQYDTIRDGCI